MSKVLTTGNRRAASPSDSGSIRPALPQAAVPGHGTAVLLIRHVILQLGRVPGVAADFPALYPPPGQASAATITSGFSRAPTLAGNGSITSANTAPIAQVNGRRADATYTVSGSWDGLSTRRRASARR